MSTNVEAMGSDRKQTEFRQAVLLWLAFLLTAILMNGTVPFLLGADLHAWTSSSLKSILFSFSGYAVLFFLAPLLLVKGGGILRRPEILLPVLAGMAAFTFWRFLPGIAAVGVAVLAYLHWRCDLSSLGFRSQGWKGDLAAVLFMGLLFAAPAWIGSHGGPPDLGGAASAGLARLFANPASSIENLFYYGFLTERLSPKTGPWLTPFLIGGMYTLHEMTNPEYWYEGMQFGVIFVGVSIFAAVYLWRRSTPVMWLGDGLGRFLTALI